MRLNFQQQRAINPSAPANTFIAEREAPGMNQFAMQRQIIEEATNALQDTAKAAAIVANAYQKAEQQDENNDLEAFADDAEKKADEMYFDFSQTNKGISSLDTEMEFLESELNKIQETESAGRSKRKLIIKDIVGNLRKSYMQKASANTKNNSIKALLNAEDQIMDSSDPIEKKILNYSNIAESYRPTLGVDVDKK